LQSQKKMGYYGYRSKYMPRKTLALISGLVLVTVVLFVIALRTNKAPQAPQTQNTTQQAAQPTPTTPAHSVLSLSPNPVNVAVGGKGSVAVNIDTSDNAVTAIQLELAYDPTMISNVQVTPGTMIQNPVVLINKNNIQTGRYTYAFGIQPNHETVNGTGAVATITFTAKGIAGKQSQLALLPSTLVTARGVANSVLKSETGTMIMIGGAGAAAGNTGVTGAGTGTAQPGKLVVTNTPTNY
jgi:hypothetical protein